MTTYSERVNRFLILRHEELPEAHQAAYRAAGIDPKDNWSLIWSFSTRVDAEDCLRDAKAEAASWMTHKMVDNGEATTIERVVW